MLELSNEQTHEPWLTGLEPYIRGQFSCRLGLRCIPLVAKLQPTVDEYFDGSKLLLSSFECAIKSVVASVTPEGKGRLKLTERCARASGRNTNNLTPATFGNYEFIREEKRRACGAAIPAAESISCTASTLFDNFSMPKISAITAARGLRYYLEVFSGDLNQDGFSEARNDAQTLSQIVQPSFAIYSTPLWRKTRTESELREDRISVLGEWDFWREWYQGFLDGNPVHWELQKRVADIHERAWIAGPKVVAKEIDKVRSKFSAELANTEVIEYVTKLPYGLVGIGHNNPPESINDFPIISYELNQIKTATFVVQSELIASTPDKSKLSGALDDLGKVLSSVAKWIARKLDISLDEFLKTLAKSGAVAVSGVAGAWLLGLHSKIHTLVEALIKYLGMLP